ncbi:MAG TPA: hypothetical protein PLX15_02175 [Candidatus Woesearchaeota archaeon]|nr:hypothetical protein [Candidatus Woesearchaeota archaeon]
MTYEVTFSDFADKQLSKLPLDVQDRIISTIKRCQIRPYSHVKNYLEIFIILKQRSVYDDQNIH